MIKLNMELVNNMSEDAMRQLLRDEVVEQHLAEQAEAERIAAEEQAKREESARMDAFFAERFRHTEPRFGDQY